MANMFLVCILSTYAAVFPPDYYSITDRGSVVGYDIIRRRDELIPSRLVEKRCVYVNPAFILSFLEAWEKGHECTIEGEAGSLFIHCRGPVR